MGINYNCARSEESYNHYSPPAQSIQEFKKLLPTNIEENYPLFYNREVKEPFFFQGDIINGFPVPYFEKGKYINRYQIRSILLSNTCDMSEDNKRSFDMNVCIAPVQTVSNFLYDLDKDLQQQIYDSLKKQLITNLFYLPPTGQELINDPRHKGYICNLDQIFNLPLEILLLQISHLEKIRDESLSHFGLYLLVTKISYHFCRYEHSKLKSFDDLSIS